jgi:hypothetical protein
LIVLEHGKGRQTRVVAVEKNNVPLPVFVKRAQKVIENKGSTVQKACKSSELFDNNGDKQEIAMNPGLAHGTGAKCLGV